VFTSVCPEAKVGKILIQRNEETAEPILFYSKIPDIRDKDIMLLDPMLATGGSAICAINILKDKGADEARITFVNVVSCPEGIKAIMEIFPKLRIITAGLDNGLNEKKYIVPGLGDFGISFIHFPTYYFLKFSLLFFRQVIDFMVLREDIFLLLTEC